MAMYDAAYHPGVLARTGEGLSGAQFLDSNTDYDLGEHSPHGGCSELDDYGDAGYPTIISTLGGKMAGVGGRVIENGKRLFYNQRQAIQMGEGPTMLRFLCFLGGFGMFISSAISMINIFALLTGPSTYILQIYQGFFGLITMIVEAKDWDCLDQFKPWMTEWFRFLTVPAGKGAFYVFVGSLGLSLWIRNILAFTVGLYMSAMGLICIAVHAGLNRKQLADNNYERAADISDGQLDDFGDSEIGGRNYFSANNVRDDDLRREFTTTTTTGPTINNTSFPNRKGVTSSNSK